MPIGLRAGARYPCERLTRPVLGANTRHALPVVLVVTLADQTQHRIFGD